MNETNQLKTLYIIRGLPGSGKTTLARKLAPNANAAADDFFEKLGKFDPSKLSDAHAHCQADIESYMRDNEEAIAVHNTFSQSWEMNHYFKLAHKYGYSTFAIECQNDFGSIHDVPQHAIENMRNRWHNYSGKG